MKDFYSYEFCGAGKLIIGTEDGFVTDLRFRAPDPAMGDCAWNETVLHARAEEQLKEYFAGERRRFDLPLRPKGSGFFLRCWRALLEIPYGETRSYRELAAAAGSPRGARAAGMACNRNPIAVIIPCHRVVGADGSLTGFGGGLGVKKFLLDLESGGAFAYKKQAGR